LEKLDIDGIGEFLEMAGTLIEIKSRMVLPHADEVEEPLDDPRQDFVGSCSNTSSSATPRACSKTGPAAGRSISLGWRSIDRAAMRWSANRWRK
jgi:chromatin segregation and condensation protein Rec8/ScpA/Scc1 (kleisin family)